MSEPVAREIRRLHRFFEGWFTGRLPETDQAFAGVRDALAEGFVLVSPRGHLDARDELLAQIRGAHGGRDAGFAIRIEDVRIRHDQDDLIVATYEEWQSTPGEPARGRLSTVVFERGADRLAWLHVHETWLPSTREDADPSG